MITIGHITYTPREIAQSSVRDWLEARHGISQPTQIRTARAWEAVDADVEEALKDRYVNGQRKVGKGDHEDFRQLWLALRGLAAEHDVTPLVTTPKDGSVIKPWALPWRSVTVK